MHKASWKGMKKQWGNKKQTRDEVKRVDGQKTGIDITLEVVCGKWKGLILWKLLHEDHMRFNELRRAIDGNISSRILARELKKTGG